MYTLGNQTATKMHLAESWALAIGFVAAQDVARGQVVKLVNGQLEPITATTDEPFGVLEVGAKAGEKATVITDFKAVVNSKADGDLDIGDKVSVSSYDSVNENDNYKESATGDFVVGIAISAALDTEDVTIAILRAPYKLA